MITGDSKFSSGCQCLSLMLAILEPHIKKTTHFCELREQGSIYSALYCEMKLTIAILDFDVRLYGGPEWSKHHLKMIATDAKNAKFEPILIFL